MWGILSITEAKPREYPIHIANLGQLIDDAKCFQVTTVSWYLEGKFVVLFGPIGVYTLSPTIQQRSVGR